MPARRKPTRLLLAYATLDEALAHLGGPRNEIDQTELDRITTRWREAVERRQTSGPRSSYEPEVQPLPADLASRAANLSQDPTLQVLLQSLQPTFAMVGLANLISAQKFVYTDGNEDILSLDPVDQDQIARISLPETQLRPVQVIQDAPSNSYTMASNNPNLRIGGMAQSQVGALTPGGGQHPLQIYGFFLTHGGPWMQVAQLQGRWFLRDGYHRAYAFLRRGITRVPCIVVTATTLEELGLVRPGFVGADVLAGERPPLVGDFLDDSVAMDGALIPTRKIVRIRAEEFVVPADEPD
jgi:hypothetical protein